MHELRYGTAVIVLCGPALDKTNGVSLENALTISNERITMIMGLNNGSAPTIVLDNITGATSGTNNDLNYVSGASNAMFGLELTVANTSYYGNGKITITDDANHCPIIENIRILSQADWDAKYGTGTRKVDVDTIKTQTVTCAAGVTVLASVGTAATSTAQTGDAYGRLGAPAGASVSADIAAVKSDSAAILTDTAEIGAAGAGLTVLATAANLATVDTVVDGIKAKTDSLNFTVPGYADVNIQYVNDVAIIGDGSATPWGPA